MVDPKCDGQGLVGGSGTNELIGKTSTCTDCKGTGQLPDGEPGATVPTEMITDEMREAGIDENTPLKTREEMVAELGEEEVARIESEAKTAAEDALSQPSQPPVDNEHVADGAAPFDQATVDANTPVQETEGKGILGKVVDAILG